MIGLLILAIGALAAVGAWLLAWYRGRQEEPGDPEDPGTPGEPAAEGEPGPADDPGVAEAPTEPTDRV
jgi:hypothetical protein